VIVFSDHCRSASAGSILPSGNVVIRPSEIARWTAEWRTPRRRAYSRWLTGCIILLA